jgi:membrane protease YdiL (CAAX protease family)
MELTIGDAMPAPQPPAGDTGRGDASWTLNDLLFAALWFIGLFVVFPLPFALPFYRIYGDTSDQYFIATMLLGVGSEVGLGVVAAWFSFRKYGGGWERLGVRTPTWATVGWAVVALLAAVAVNLTYAGIINLFDIGALKSACDDQVPKELLASTPSLIVASAVFVTFPPVFEEIFFRGFVFPGLRRAWGLGIAVVLSGLLFSLAHISGSLDKTIIPIAGIGMAFALAYWRSGNIFTVMLAHFANNVIAVVGLWGCR